MSTEQSKEERILLAAQREFAAKGFYETVVSDIADLAGVGKGTVYRRFGNKEQLLTTLMKHGSDDFLRRLEAASGSGDTPLRTLECCIDAYFEFFHTSRQLIEIVILEGKPGANKVSQELLDNDERIRKHLSRVISRGIEQGVFLPLDPDDLAMLLHNTIWSALRGSIIFHQDISRLRDTLKQVFLRGACSSPLEQRAEA